MRPIVPLLVAALLAFAACVPQRHSPLTDAPCGRPSHLALRLKVQWRSDGQRQSGRAAWLVDGDRGKLLLFDPLHRPLLEIQCRGERVLAINRRRNRCWSGAFSEALVNLWGIELTLAELRAAIEDGRVPASGSRPGLRVEVTLRAGRVRQAVFSTAATRLQVQVLERRLRAGPVSLVAPGHAMPQVDLRELLAHD